MRRPPPRSAAARQGVLPPLPWPRPPRRVRVPRARAAHAAGPRVRPPPPVAANLPARERHLRVLRPCAQPAAPPPRLLGPVLRRPSTPGGRGVALRTSAPAGRCPAAARVGRVPRRLGC